MAITTHRGKLVLDLRHTWPDGRRERIRIRVPNDKLAPRKAAAFERTVLAQLRAGIDPRKQATAEPIPNDQPKPRPTLTEFWPDFAEYQASAANKRTNRARMLYENERMFVRWIEPVLGSRRLNLIGSRDADRLAARMERGEVTGRKLGAASVANGLGLLRRMLSVARRWDLIEEVPEINVRKPKPDRIEDEAWLTLEECDRLLAAARPGARTVVLFGIRTGLRFGELRALRWQDVDLVGRRLYVRRAYDDRLHKIGPPKSGRSREVPLTWDVVALLERRPRTAALVFPGRDDGRPFSRTWLGKMLRLAAEQAGIAKHVHPHMLRHTYASHCVAQGIPSRVLMAWGGWASEAMLARYAHLEPRDVQHWVDRIAPKMGPLGAVLTPEVGTVWVPPEADKRKRRSG